MDKDKNPFKEKKEIEEKENNLEEEKEIKEETEEKEENKEETDDDSLKEKYEELNNKYIRLAADFDNFRKRTISEKDELSTYTTIEILKKITGVLDTFDRAREHLKDIDNCQTVKESYEVAYKQFLDALKKMGMEEINALGQEFNPNEHEAITQVQTDEYEPDKIAVVAQKGYKLKDRVIRPALVGVAIKKENE